MPADTEKQARFMRMVAARKAGHKVGGPKVQKAAAHMSGEEARKMMHTKGNPKTILGGRKGY